MKLRDFRPTLTDTLKLVQAVLYVFGMSVVAGAGLWCGVCLAIRFLS